MLYVCESCGKTHAMGRSCGNRHCPTCQQDKTKAWLETQTARLLPCPYFLVTFTLPAELRHWPAATSGWSTRPSSRPPARRCEAQLAANPKFVGTDRIGFFGVLHTWGRTGSTTRTCTTWCPAGASARTVVAGYRRAPTSSCPRRPCRSSSGPSSATSWRGKACWTKWTPPCGGGTGSWIAQWSATAVPRCSISPRTSFASPSATGGSSRTMTAQ